MNLLFNEFGGSVVAVLAAVLSLGIISKVFPLVGEMIQFSIRNFIG